MNPVHHPIITGALLGIVVAMAILATLGMAVMRDVYQGLNFSALSVSWSAGLIAVAVWIEDNDPQAWIKVVLIALILFVMNSILTHMTAKAARIRQRGHWPLEPEEGIEVIGAQHFPSDSKPKGPGEST